MEYVFGVNGETEVLKTKGSSHTDLTGYHQTVQTYPDRIITDNFRIVCKLDSKEDEEGNCYDWYEIDRHYRIDDKTMPLAEKATAMEDAVCELDTAIEERLSALEDAVCELDSLLNGGEINE